jgi:glutathione reductase (NADPH)
VDTTIVYRGDCLLRGFDEDMRRGLDAGLRGARHPPDLRDERARPAQARRDIVATFSDGVEAPFGAVMFATGPYANVDGIGLEEVGVRLTPDGFIEVDAYSQTSVPSIYAVGDVTGRRAADPRGHSGRHRLCRDGVQQQPHSGRPVAGGNGGVREPEVATIG